MGRDSLKSLKSNHRIGVVRLKVLVGRRMDSTDRTDGKGKIGISVWLGSCLVFLLIPSADIFPIRFLFVILSIKLFDGGEEEVVVTMIDNELIDCVCSYCYCYCY